MVVGPEVPLTAGTGGRTGAAGIRFGPSGRRPKWKASKVFAKDFMDRHAIPSARYAAFPDFQQAAAHLQTTPTTRVIKASGLAAGKGVILPETPRKP